MVRCSMHMYARACGGTSLDISLIVILASVTKSLWHLQIHPRGKFVWRQVSAAPWHAVGSTRTRLHASCRACTLTSQRAQTKDLGTCRRLYINDSRIVIGLGISGICIRLHQHGEPVGLDPDYFGVVEAASDDGDVVCEVAAAIWACTLSCAQGKHGGARACCQAACNGHCA